VIVGAIVVAIAVTIMAAAIVADIVTVMVAAVSQVCAGSQQGKDSLFHTIRIGGN